ncbi:hypothetical protein C1889_01140 [Pseudomonas sp. FW507-12TSA]|nr:hypothetical protein C1889_01140 [Pseudomonas sp. FW507-12TSA]
MGLFFVGILAGPGLEAPGKKVSGGEGLLSVLGTGASRVASMGRHFALIDGAPCWPRIFLKAGKITLFSGG